MSEPGHVLYRHWGKDGQLLYAGMTNNPPARLTDHRGTAAWWAEVSWTTYEKFPSREALKAGETWVIKNEHPQWNIQERDYAGQSRTSLEPGTDRYSPVTSGSLRPEIRLVHPLSRGFHLYGGSDTVRRARQWALNHRYYLLDSGPRCAHALYRMWCPNYGRTCLPGADHTQVWVPAPDYGGFKTFSGAEEPFILTQPYIDGETIPAEMAAYAAAHGLRTDLYSFDDWYNPGSTTAIRFTGNSSSVYPLGVDALSLMCAWRDDWPETIPEWL